MNCPICNSIMHLSKKRDIEEKYCQQCNEFWPSKRSNKQTVQSSIFLNQLNNEGYNQRNHIYSRTNNHEFMDDKKRNKELLFLIE
jgi:Zn-finger nucleic acid-binding protein